MIDQAEIHRMAQSEDAYCREGDACQLFFHYKKLPDKEQAWNDLCQLINDKINNVLRSATEALGVSFPYIQDKLQAWDDLYRLTLDENRNVRPMAFLSLKRKEV